MSLSLKPKIFVVDDTRTFRAILKEALGELSDQIELIGEASDGLEALKSPFLPEADIVLLDIYLPNLNGLEVLKEMKKRFLKPAVIMMSDSADQNTPITISALTQGALDFIHKDPNPRETRLNRTYLKNELLRVIALVANAKHQSLGTAKPIAVAGPSQTISVRRRLPQPFSFSLIVIGVSTGGPKALNYLLPKLPSDLGCPVLLVQHMPEKFTASLAESLNQQCALSVKEAVHGEKIVSNTVFIAPGGRHMEVSGGFNANYTLKITQDPPVLSCRPSVNVLFNSVARNWMVGNVLALVLTGMGQDGLDGVRDLKTRGCYCIAQNEETSTVYGMPRMIVENGLADEVLPLTLIPSRIVKLVQTPFNRYVTSKDNG